MRPTTIIVAVTAAVVQVGIWEVERVTDDFTDESHWNIFSGQGNGYIAVTCDPGEPFEWSIGIGHAVERLGLPEVAYRVGDGPIEWMRLDLGDPDPDGSILGMLLGPLAPQLVSRLSEARLFRVRFTSVGGSLVTARWDLVGLADALGEVPCEVP